MIADETEKVVKDFHEKAAVTAKYFRNRTGAVSAPVDLVPAQMLELQVKELYNGKLYCLSFRKPPGAETEVTVTR